MDSFLKNLTTEQVNKNTKNIDSVDTIEILNMINTEDMKVAYAVQKELNNIKLAVDLIYDRLKSGGRLFYIGSGTSGRLGVLDASECPPTYGTDPEMVQGIIAGGQKAVINSVEGAEDSKETGANIIKDKNINVNDVVVGITASGCTPFVLGAVEEAKKNGIKTVGISNNIDSIIKKEVDIAITPIVGAEVIMGSTRMKAGTSQKLVLNMITTAVMIKLGKVYENLMVDLKQNNLKLKDRAVRIIMYATGTEKTRAYEYLKKSDCNTKTAIVMIKTGTSKDESNKLLRKTNGFVKRAIELHFKGHAENQR